MAQYEIIPEQGKDEDLVLEWIQLRKDLDEDEAADALYDKLYPSYKYNPYVAGGVAATAGLFVWGLKNMNHKWKGHLGMQGRCVMQAVTLTGLLIGYLRHDSEERKKKREKQARINAMVEEITANSDK